MTSPGARLREAWTRKTIAIPGAFNALSARIVERLGFDAVYLSGGALSAGWAGVPDIGLLSLTEFVQQAEILASTTSLPLLCDADTGFGEALNVERCVEKFERAGAAGIHLEDQVLPKRCGHLTGKALIGTAEMSAKIRAAVRARRDPDFVIVARTDCRSVLGFDAVLERAQAYREAGADMIFAEALETEQEFSEFATRFDGAKLANMTEFGRGPLLSVDELGALGYQAVLFPLTAFRAAMKAAEEMLSLLKTSGTQRQHLAQMQTRAELYDRLGYTEWEDRDKAYFGNSER